MVKGQRASGTGGIGLDFVDALVGGIDGNDGRALELANVEVSGA